MFPQRSVGCRWCPLKPVAEMCRYRYPRELGECGVMNEVRTMKKPPWKLDSKAVFSISRFLLRGVMLTVASFLPSFGVTFFLRFEHSKHNHTQQNAVSDCIPPPHPRMPGVVFKYAFHQDREKQDQVAQDQQHNAPSAKCDPEPTRLDFRNVRNHRTFQKIGVWEKFRLNHSFARVGHLSDPECVHAAAGGWSCEDASSMGG